MDNKTKDALKQLQAEIRQLQAAIGGRESLKTEVHLGEDDEVAVQSDIAVQYKVQFTHLAHSSELQKNVTYSFTQGQLARVASEAAAALGYALASVQKIALLRALLGKDRESAAQLGELSGLSTGSLYHHLRELMHAGLVRQGGRNQYALTDRGRRVLLVVLALAVEAEGGAHV